MVNSLGEEVLPAVYEHIDDFHNGMNRIEQNGKYGFVNQKGKIIIPVNLNYDDVDHFDYGLCQVAIDDRYGSIDKTGRLVIPSFYDKLLAINEELVLARKEGKWALVDKLDFTSYPPMF